MTCSCIKGDFNLIISYLDCKTMLIEDFSTWMDDTGYVLPETYTVTVKSPTKGSEKDIEVKTQGVTRVTAKDLFGGSENECIPSDIYCFKTVSCVDVPYTIHKPYLCRYKCAIDGIFARGDYERANALESVVRGIESSIESGMPDTAKDILELLSRKLKNEKCGCG